MFQIDHDEPFIGVYFGVSISQARGFARPVSRGGPLRIWEDRFVIVVTCARGAASILAGEITALGLPVTAAAETAVETEGTLDDAMRLNLALRSAQRVLCLLASREAPDPQGLYLALKTIPWEEVLEPDGYLTVTSAVDNETIRDARYANMKAKDAIVDRLARRFGRRPDAGPERRGVVVHLHWRGRRCLVYLDTSGEPLSRRGYRKVPLEAPMQETLAAAVLLAAGWDGKGNLVNPMCGSGTIAIEGALIALGRAPGLTRTDFGFRHLRGFDEGRLEALRRSAAAASRPRAPGLIVATDIRPEAVRAARENAARAGVERVISFSCCDFRKTPVPEGGGIVVLNPAYGERMGDIRRLAGLYGEIGDFFKRRCPGYRGYIFTGNLELAKKVGLRTKRRLTFYNGPLPCRLLEYDLYGGRRRGDEPAGAP